MPCICGHEHDWETGICKHPSACYCIKYREASEYNPVVPVHQKYLEQLKKVEDKVKYILENIQETRNMKNKDFVFLYWHLVSKLNIISNDVIKRLDDPESIRRCRQLLVQSNPDKYGETDLIFKEEKGQKQNATYQYVLEKYL